MLDSGPIPDPFDYPGNSIGALLIHGFTSSPAEVRPLGQYLARQGYTVVAPLLPGHGTRWQDLAGCQWEDWTISMERAYIQLKERCHTIFIVGVSMGGLITLYLAERHPEIAGIVVMSPALAAADWRAGLAGILKYLIPFAPRDPSRDDLGDREAYRRYMWTYNGAPLAATEQLLRLQNVVRRKLHNVVMPTLVMGSHRDTVVRPSSAQVVLDRISSHHKEMAWFDKSGHALWIDVDKERAWEKTCAFIATHAC